MVDQDSVDDKHKSNLEQVPQKVSLLRGTQYNFLRFKFFDQPDMVNTELV